MARSTPHRVRTKRAYAAPSDDDGCRVLVDRLWPRGLARKALALDAWVKDAAPSDELRQWFNHDVARWGEFVTRYRAELKQPPASEAVAELVRYARQRSLTLVYGARDEAHNNAIVLSEIVTQRLQHKS